MKLICHFNWWTGESYIILYSIVKVLDSFFLSIPTGGCLSYYFPKFHPCVHFYIGTWLLKNWQWVASCSLHEESWRRWWIIFYINCILKKRFIYTLSMFYIKFMKEFFSPSNLNTEISITLCVLKNENCQVPVPLLPLKI